MKQNNQNFKNLKKLIIIGGGSGDPAYLLPVAQNILCSPELDCVIAPERFRNLLQDLLKNKNLKTEILKDIPAFLEQLPERLQSEQIAVIVSGDPLFYSLCRTILARYPDLNTEIIPGIGSLQLLGTAFGLTMEDTVILSLHGREYNPGTIRMTVAEHSLTCFFCSADHGAREIAEILDKLNNLKLYIGENLGCPEQKLYTGSPEEFRDFRNPKLHVVAVKNPDPRPVSRPALLPDDAFLRNQSPMTKEEVRAVILSKLRLQPAHVVWDIGAGTGSISVECARFCPSGRVCAVEYKPEALEILEQNRQYFNLQNLEIIAGKAPDVLGDLPLPDRVFIGGTEGGFRDILGILKNLKILNHNIRLVASAVTLESQAEIYELLKDFPDLEITQISVAHAKPIKHYHVLQGNHPVMIYSCTLRYDQHTGEGL